MEYVRFGNTGLKVSRLCLGTMTFGSPTAFLIGKPTSCRDDLFIGLARTGSSAGEGKEQKRASEIVEDYRETVRAEVVVDGAVDGDTFEAWAEQALLPWLNPDQVVIWDKVSPHQRPRVKTLVESVGCSVIFLPAYSPTRLLRRSKPFPLQVFKVG